MSTGRRTRRLEGDIPTSLGVERDVDMYVHCFTVVLAVIILVMVVANPIIVVLAKRLLSRIQEARRRMQTRIQEGQMRPGWRITN